MCRCILHVTSKDIPGFPILGFGIFVHLQTSISGANFVRYQYCKMKKDLYEEINNDLRQFNERITNITITDEYRNNTQTISFLGCGNYYRLFTYVYEKFGGCTDQFELRRVGDNKIYPRCLDHMLETRAFKNRMDARNDDHFILPRLDGRPKHYNMSDNIQEGSLQITDKATQTEGGFPACDVVQLLVRYRRYNCDVYMRLNNRIIDFTSSVLQHLRISIPPGDVEWALKGKTFNGNDPSTIAFYIRQLTGTEDATDVYGSDEEEDIIYENIYENAGCEPPSRNYSARYNGVLTVARPGIQYQPVQSPRPPPPRAPLPPRTVAVTETVEYESDDGDDIYDYAFEGHPSGQFSARSIGLQTVARPGILYPPVQPPVPPPPPPPPSAKT